MLKHIVCFRVSMAILLSTAPGLAQSTIASSSAQPSPDIIRKAVQNEIKISNDGHHYMFRGVKTTPDVSTTKLYVETDQGTAGMAIAYNGKPLTADQRRAEQDRMDRLLKDPSELQKKRKREKDDAARTIKILAAIPDAFLFEYAGEASGAPGLGRPGDPLVKFKFRPNPDYSPPSRVEQVLTGMQGVVLVDAVRLRLAQIDGTLFKDVGFGWGILGHLDKGGHFLVQQQEVDPNRWDISKMSLDFTGKILFFKNLAIKSTEVFSGFKPVPTQLTFSEAVEMIKKQETASSTSSPSSNVAAKNSAAETASKTPEVSLPEP